MASILLTGLKYSALNAAFKVAYGDDFDVALATAIMRCEEKEWSADGGHEASDLRALILASEIVGANAAENHPDVDELLARTWATLAKKDGYDGTQKGDGTTSNILIALAAIIIVAEAAVIAYAIYRASQLVNSIIAQHEASQEMMRAHAQAMQVVEAHRLAEEKAGHAIPYNEGEKAILEGLQQAQDNAQKITTGTITTSEGSGVAEVGGGVLLGLGLAAVALYVALGRK